MTHSNESEERPAYFKPSANGYLRHWLVAGPRETPYEGPPGTDQVLRRDALDYTTPAPQVSVALGEPGPFSIPWRFHDPGKNEFVELSTFYQTLTIVEYYAFTEVIAPEEIEVAARFWVAGAADLWVNDEHCLRFNVTRYRNPDSQSLLLRLKKGTNRLYIRAQCLGVRDTRILFGLTLDAEVVVRMPGATKIAQASEWIDTVRAATPSGLESTLPAPFDAKVTLPTGAEFAWPAGGSAFDLSGPHPSALTVEVTVDGAILQRQLEIPANRPQTKALKRDRRIAHLEYVAKAGVGDEPPPAWNASVLPLLARRLLGRRSEVDAGVFAAAIAMVDARGDCADFVLAGLLRLEWLGLSLPEESAEIRRAALSFRYWSDEPGNDAMCFHSENHTLLFHGCQLLAGRLYPEEIFLNSGRGGVEQAAQVLPKIDQWLQRIESHGFEEFNSGTYMPITIAAMLNAVDFSGDSALASRMGAQIDRIFRDLADHSFGGGVVTPQGRVYRDVLTPEESGTNVVLCYTTDAADVLLDGPRSQRGGTGDWVVFPASSPRYSPPNDLSTRILKPVSRVYRHADIQIVLEKTPAYLLTSLAVPAPPRAGEQPDNDLRPGGAGYQQHLWQATLGRDCHIFVNHPGGFHDGTKSRPGYWHGNGLLPRVRQKENWLQAIYVIADGTKTKPEITNSVWHWGSSSTIRPFDLHPIPFTHAHWPEDSFDRVQRSGHWVFGQKGRGLIGLWCSESLVAHDDVLTGRELRANSYSSAWLVICGDLKQEGSLEGFITSCQKREPSFDRTSFILSMAGETPTRWWERSEPMPS